MYYLKIINHTGVKGPDGKYKFKINRLPIDKKTFDLLYECQWGWWTPGLSKDIDSSTIDNIVEDKLSDIFYLIVTQIIEKKLGMTNGEDFDFTGDFDATENDIEIDIEMIK